MASSEDSDAAPFETALRLRLGRCSVGVLMPIIMAVGAGPVGTAEEERGGGAGEEGPGGAVRGAGAGVGVRVGVVVVVVVDGRLGRLG